MENKATAYIQVPINEKSTTTDISGDFTLPDYQPEIKRLLKVCARALPPTKYIGDSEGEFSGAIDYYVHYIGSDNQIYCAPLSAEYKTTVPMDKNELTLVNVTADAEIFPESAGGRVTSPRKLNLKCRLKTRARMYGDMPLDMSFSKMGGDNQVLIENKRITRRMLAQSEMINLSDEIIQGKDSDARVVSADGHLLIGEVSAIAGAVNVKGELYLSLLVCRESDGVPYTMLRRIPFSETVVTEGADVNSHANAKGCVCEMSINVDDDRIGIDVGVILEVSACKNESVSYVKDMFSTSHESECAYRSIPTLCEGRAFNANFTQSDAMTLEDAGLTPEHKIVDISGTAYPEGAVLEGGRWIFTGRSKYSVIASKDGEYSCVDIEMPYRYSVEAKEADGDGSYASATAEIINSRARLDGERIGIDGEIMLSGVISCPDTTVMLDSVSFGAECERARGEYVICYPSNSDSVWSVAKRYGRTVELLCRANKLKSTDTPDSSATLEGVHFLVV